MKETVVLYAGIGTGHLVPMVALAKLFLRHDFAVTIVTVDAPQVLASSAKLISDMTVPNRSISFHILPAIPIPAEYSPNGFIRMLYILRESNQNFLDFLVSISKTTSVRCILLDMFCAAALEITDKLHLPTYFFYASAASVLAAILHLPVLDKILHTSLKDMGRTLIDFPGLPSMPANDLPPGVQDRSNECYKLEIANAPRLVEAYGMLINTFEELESKAVKALRAGLSCYKMPPIYCIGPLITERKVDGSEMKHDCLTWIDLLESVIPKSRIRAPTRMVRDEIARDEETQRVYRGNSRRRSRDVRTRAG